MTIDSYFSLLKEKFQTQPSHQVSEKCLIGGSVFNLIFPNKGIRDLFNLPFERTERYDENSFTVHIWDSVCSNKEIVPSRWGVKDYRQKGEIEGFQSQEYRLVFDVGSQALSMVNLKNRQGYFWTPDLMKLPYWEKGSPLRNIIHWFLQLDKKHLTHGAAVAFPTGGVLIVGKGGSGKSTTALSCLKTELLYCSDDYCAVENNGLPSVHQVYSTAKMVSKETKVVLDVKKQHPEKMINRFPLKAIIFPKICMKKEPELKEAKKSLLLRELAVSTMLQLPGENREMLPFFSEVVKSVPCHTLELSSNYLANAKHLENFIRSQYVG